MRSLTPAILPVGHCATSTGDGQEQPAARYRSVADIEAAVASPLSARLADAVADDDELLR